MTQTETSLPLGSRYQPEGPPRKLDPGVTGFDPPALAEAQFLALFTLVAQVTMIALVAISILLSNGLVDH